MDDLSSEAIDLMAMNLFEALEHYDPTDSPPWEEMPDSDKEIWRHSVARMLDFCSPVIRVIEIDKADGLTANVLRKLAKVLGGQPQAEIISSAADILDAWAKEAKNGDPKPRSDCGASGSQNEPPS